MRFVEQKNDWDLIIPFKEDCFDLNLYSDNKFEKLTHDFLFAFQDSGDCEAVPSYCFASSKDLTKVYYPFKYNEFVVAYLELDVSKSGVVSFTLEEFIDGLDDADLPHSVTNVIERDYDEVNKSSICFSCHLFLKYKRPCHYIQEFPKLAGHITKLNVFQKVGAHSWEIYDTVKIANINGVAHIVALTINEQIYEINPLMRIEFNDLGTLEEFKEGWGEDVETLLPEILDAYTDTICEYDNVANLDIIIDDNNYFYGDMLTLIKVDVLNSIAPEGWTFIEEEK